MSRGSSPLARGLPPTPPPHGAGSGIIPARAGFTPGHERVGVGAEDHPRSRGVYRPLTGPRRRAAGSSPLARGLPARERRSGSIPRIIPARAGFTRWTGAPGPPRSDHPRSRGVYSATCGRTPAASGSSPLARGLRGRLPRDGARHRIIPARAGFTTGTGAPSVWAADHPRSRGVYRTASPTGTGAPGSSPLARGLRPEGGLGRLHGGIIPARAGFTSTVPRRSGSGPDHPRSRGVYVISQLFEGYTTGSSPLARGLPLLHCGEPGPRRIIPARAGFTLGERPTFRGRGGSSPLARGLRGGGVDDRLGPGIIPARAGFTAPRARRARRDPDHPRSRGVYRALTRRPMADAGSSPLARGLRVPVARPRPGHGIIPARAGFTLRLRGDLHDVGDHPRSRGVYLSWDRAQENFGGSSPLARGLPPAPAVTEPWFRIIPARAGFTVFPTHACTDRRDHPRSRGVYTAAGPG